MSDNLLNPEFIFEVSWEVCNNAGGIYTVVSSKARTLYDEYDDNLIFIGPDVWRSSSDNPEFTEDPELFLSWRLKAREQGLVFKVGRWNIPGNPIAIIVDFTGFISQKDEIFKEAWEAYNLDSLSGGWDYVEPVLFGYAAGKVIESYFRCKHAARLDIVAHFHEWMTGAGVLYLHEKIPQIATVFTAHSTILGKSIASSDMALYSQLNQIDIENMTKELSIISKQSLEKLSAQSADCFTTVSSLTAEECSYFLKKEVDIITPNGFDDSIVPLADIFSEKREEARELMFKVAGILFGYKIERENCLLLGCGGRYEYKSKGLDIMLDSLGQLRDADLSKNLLVFVMVPANHYGPRKKLIEKLAHPEKEIEFEQKILTHGLHDAELDPIMKKIKEFGFSNGIEERVKIVFVPSVLNGGDGIFNKNFYDMLIGFDLTLFPVYYEPWGYTPLESLSFHVPTITTTLSGMGAWIKEKYDDTEDGIEILERDDENREEVVAQVVKNIVNFSRYSKKEFNRSREKAYYISRIALWKNLIKYYKQAYDIALRKVRNREDTFQIKEPIKLIDLEIKRPVSNKPVWKRLFIDANLPEKFRGLKELSNNLWWTWNDSASDLFEYIDSKLWNKVHHNPLVLLEEVSYRRFTELEADNYFLDTLNSVYDQFKEYMAKATDEVPKLAYFSMEYGFHDTLKIFSGGLGILAGDYLKEASDSNVKMVAVGLLYRYGYFKQELSISGEQLAIYNPQKFSHMCIEPIRDGKGNWKKIMIALPGRALYARIWKVNVGRIKLYLLDTDFNLNLEQDRSITHMLYGGDLENRLKQEILLGIGGIKMLSELGMKPDLYHCNEGHAAFIGLERMRVYIQHRKFSFLESLEIVRSSTLFTTHTPVPAGHDAFDEDLLRTYLAHYSQELDISWNQFTNLGKIHPDDVKEKFSMSYLAANLSMEINGVSMLHGDVSREILKDMWQGYFPEELNIGYVTNGVHFASWTAKEWKELYDSEFKDGFRDDLSNGEYWKAIYQVDDEKIWKIRLALRNKLIEYIRDRYRRNAKRRHQNPKDMIKVLDRLKKDCLTIGFARRFATYKRAHLLFKNLKRLEKIVNNPGKTVQFIFAGKAHPHDKGGQEFIKDIVAISKKEEFVGKIIFVENYDIELAQKMVAGVDIWMNTPTRPLEASGTSGMKAVMNGTLHFSVLDGWWVEGYQPEAGWALDQERTYENQDFQDELDSETIYSMLENEIVPLFYDRDSSGLPKSWISYVKNSIAHIAPAFTTKRMIDDYNNKYYSKLDSRTDDLQYDDYKMAKVLSSWKKKVSLEWGNIKIVSLKLPDPEKRMLKMGDKYHFRVVLDLANLTSDDIGIEIVIAEIGEREKVNIKKIEEFGFVGMKEGFGVYEIEISPHKPGAFNYGLRLFAKNENLPHKQDFPFVMWI